MLANMLIIWCHLVGIETVLSVGSQIILSQILAIQNNTGQTPNNFTIIKSITISLVYVSQEKSHG